ncbi:MAG TPA: hypothetical protein VE621_20205 [Bryobacteraceae bacterium]|nr:hypothetical protein [Bryobacteraceae bacterium]
MKKQVFLTAAVCALAVPSLFADFSYEQTSKVTGGAMQGMMKFAGAFNKQLREPIVSTVAVSGKRMANISRDNISVIDLDKGTITDINLKDRSYSVISFAEMTAAIQRSMERANKAAAEQNAANASAKWKVNVKDTGQTKVVNGMQAKQFIFDMELEATDNKSGQSGSMVTSMETWMVPSIRGYDEVQNFYRRMAEQMAWTPGSFNMAMGGAEMAKGMQQAAKELAKMEGIPVLQVVRMSPKLTPEQQAQMAQAQQQQAQQQANQPPPPSAGELAGQAAGSAAASRMGRAGAIGSALGGFGGGFGGFGRKKKEQPQPEAQQAPPPQAAPAANQGSAAGAGALMEMTTEITSFSSSPVDTSKFAVPAGFKEVEHPMRKMR